MDTGFRRTGLLLILAAVVVSSGCMGGSSDKSGTNSTDPGNTSDTDVPEDTSDRPDYADFNVTDFSAPDAVNLSEEYTMNLTLLNWGTEKGYERFRMRKESLTDALSEFPVKTVNRTLAPGEKVTVSLKMEADDVGRFRFDWVESFERKNETVKVAVPNRTIGETFVTSWDLAYTVEKLELIPYFRYRSDGQIEKKRPSGFSNKFAALTLKLENKGTETIDPVRSDNFYIVYNGSRYEDYRFPPNAINYTQTPLQPKLEPGETMTIHKKITVPYDARKQGMTVKLMDDYNPDLYGPEKPNDVEVNWYPESG